MSQILNIGHLQYNFVRLVHTLFLQRALSLAGLTVVMFSEELGCLLITLTCKCLAISFKDATKMALERVLIIFHFRGGHLNIFVKYPAALLITEIAALNNSQF